MGETTGKKELRSLDEWGKVVLEEGKGYLEGKFMQKWLHGQPNSIMLHLSGDNFPRDFHKQGFFNITEPEKTSSRFSAITGELKNYIGRVLEDKERKVNFLMISPRFTANSQLGRSIQDLDLDPSKRWREFCYLSWQHKDSHWDSRHYNLPFEFVFFLPDEQADIFLADVIQNPDLIEAVFQHIYPGLTGSDKFQRVKADHLIITEINLNIGSSTDRNRNFLERKAEAQRVIQKPRLNFSSPVGELELF